MLIVTHFNSIDIINVAKLTLSFILTSAPLLMRVCTIAKQP